MKVLDDRGRLFGVVNAVDALVVLLVVAVLAAGAALVFGGGPPDDRAVNGTDTDPEPVRFATVEYTIPTDQATPYQGAVDTLHPVDGGNSFTLHGATHSYTPSGEIHVVASVSYRGEATVGGSRVQVGDSYGMDANHHRPAVEFLAVDQPTGDTVREERSVVLAINESRVISHAVEPGTTARIGNQTVAEIVSVTRNPDGPPARTELVGLDLAVWSDGETAWFGGRTIRVNNRLTVLTDDAVVTGRIYRIGTNETSMARRG